MGIPIDINNFLPHRAPMLMVDWILEMNDERVESVFTIGEGNVFLQNELFSESGLIENAAQTCSAIVGKQYFVDENNEAKQDVKIIGFISAIKTMNIHVLPKVGTTINTIATLTSKFVSEDYSISTMYCKTYSKDELLLDGEINLFIQERKDEKE
jgi:predicted hotdog family 3-hydroxylacyl-ACP dehydratase